MKAITLISLLLALAFPQVAHAVDFPKGYTAYYGPEKFGHALAEAKRSNKKVLVVLSIPFCPPCNYVVGMLGEKELRDVYQPNFIGVYMEWGQMSEEERDRLWRPYGRRLAPSFVFFDSDGRTICKSIGGYNIPEEALALGKKVLAATARTESSKASEAPNCSRM